MDPRTVPVSKLLLDVSNPRHGEVETQRDAIRALIDREGSRLVALARDIAIHGLNPTERLLVVEDGRNFRVLEGNRRVACIRLIGNPDLAAGTPIAAAIRRIAKTSTPPARADCIVLDDPEDADHWLLNRHTTGHRGAGVQPWNTIAATRFAQLRDGKPHQDASAGIALLDAITSGYPENQRVMELVEALADKRITTVGRLARDPVFRDKFAISGDKSGPLEFGFPKEQLEPVLEGLLQDLAENLTVTDLKTKALREAYLRDRVPDPDPKNRLQSPRPLGAQTTKVPEPSGPAKPKPPPKPKRPVKEKPLAALDLSQLGSRVQDILDEFRGLTPDKYPNAAAILLRTVVELSVDAYLASSGKRPSGEFKARINRSLKSVDPTDKDDAYQGVRQGLSDGTSIFAIATLHGFVHNADFHPDAQTVRVWARNYEPFLQALNDAV